MTHNWPLFLADLAITAAIMAAVGATCAILGAPVFLLFWS